MSATINAANFLMLSVFGIAAVGYLLGRITIKGISLGTAGVFVIALIYGAFSGTHFNSKFVIEEINYASQALKIIENLGLVFFVTSVGFIAGPNFFKNMKHNFKSYVLLGVVIILSGGITAVLCLLVGRAIEAGQPGYDPNQLTAMISGLLAGSLTSTPAFSATKEAVAAQYQDAVTVGYGIAYLFGVIGVVLFVQLMPRVVHADLDEERRKITHVETGDVAKFKGKLLEFDDFGFTPFAVAAVFGILLGSVKFFNFFSLTTTGGALLVSLVFGHFGHIGRADLMPSKKVLETFRELGLMVFLIGARRFRRHELRAVFQAHLFRLRHFHDASADGRGLYRGKARAEDEPAEHSRLHHRRHDLHARPRHAHPCRRHEQRRLRLRRDLPHRPDRRRSRLAAACTAVLTRRCMTEKTPAGFSGGRVLYLGIRTGSSRFPCRRSASARA